MARVVPAGSRGSSKPKRIKPVLPVLGPKPVRPKLIFPAELREKIPLFGDYKVSTADVKKHNLRNPRDIMDFKVRMHSKGVFAALPLNLQRGRGSSRNIAEAFVHAGFGVNIKAQGLRDKN